MDKQKLQDLIREEADRVLSNSGINDELENVTPEQIKKLAQECRKINYSLDFRKPIINDEELLSESIKKTELPKKHMKSNKPEENRWKRLVEYRNFSDDTLNESIQNENRMPVEPSDFFDYVVANGGINSSLEEGLMDKISKSSFPYIMAGYLSIFGGSISDAVAQFEKDTSTKATTELVQQGKEIAKEKGVEITQEDPSKGTPSPKIKYTETSKPEHVHHYDENGYPIYVKGTSSHAAWKQAFEEAKGKFETWKDSLSTQGVDFKTQNPTEVDAHLRYREINDRLYLVFHYGEVNPDGSPIEDTKVGNNLDYYLDLGPAPEKTVVVRRDEIPVDTTSQVQDEIPVDTTSQTTNQTDVDMGMKGVKKKFSMNVGVKNHVTRDAAGNKVVHKTGDIVNGEKITFTDGVSIMKDESGNYYDLTNPSDIKKIDPQDPEYNQYDLDGKNQIKPSDKRVIKSHIKALRKSQ